ncbi:MAG TPA: acyl-CoA dehydrogenase family protein [Candidatus Binataceae bacterium]|nr:acyl-CoA dehydrogenase family protein [Candidatus Binataceae bacterium]
MSIDFTMPPHVIEVRDKIRAFIREEVDPGEKELRRTQNWREGIRELRKKARARGLWCPHMPAEFGGMGLGPLAMAMVSAECGRSRLASFIINAQAPDEGNMHTMLHFATPAQKEKYLRPLCDGKIRSCFAMTEPEAAGSDPTQIKTHAEKVGDNWVINGHKWFISGAHGAKFAIVIAKTDPDADPPQARNSAFIVDLPNEGFKIVRDIDTMAGKGNHCEIALENVTVPADAMLGGRGEGHKLGQVRLGPARLAHCMRWIGNAEIAVEMTAKRALERTVQGGKLSEKQGIQFMLSQSALELYQAKLMVLHAAYLIENNLPFRHEVSMTKYHVANSLWRILDRAIQVHGALGFSSDTPLEDMFRHARSARLVDGADEVHLSLIARNLLDWFKRDGSTRAATGGTELL